MNNLKIGKAPDIADKKQRYLWRALEILPGGLSFGALFLVIFLSWKKPLWIAVFIIFFVLYWFFRSIYLYFHLRAGYRKMREHEKTNWLAKLNELEVKNCPPAILGKAKRAGKLKIYWCDIYHLVIFPMYEESLEIIRESFLALLRSDYPKEKIIVVLGCEQRAGDKAQKIAKAIQEEFGEKFFRLLITWHPSNLPGEILGHGSNETWAAKRAKEHIIDPLGVSYENIIVSSFDADCQVFPEYFGCLTWHYLTSENPTRTSFQPVPLYINNIWQAPLFSQIFSFSSSFWHTMNQERPDRLVSFSSHAIPFQALVDVGFKQTNVVSDDSRIFWQCFLHYDGEYSVLPLYYPVSMDANVAGNIFKTAVNVYRQQKRWAYGMGEIPYVFSGFFKNKKIPLKKKISLGIELIDGHFFWATAPIMIFLLGWLPLLFGGQEFGQTLIAYNLPKTISFILTVGMLGLVLSAHLSILLLPPKPVQYGSWKYFVFAFGWILVPLMMIFFAALPALDAQARWLFGKYMGFWPTPKRRD